MRDCIICKKPTAQRFVMLNKQLPICQDCRRSMDETNVDAYIAAIENFEDNQ